MLVENYFKQIGLEGMFCVFNDLGASLGTLPGIGVRQVCSRLCSALGCFEQGRELRWS